MDLFPIITAGQYILDIVNRIKCINLMAESLKDYWNEVHNSDKYQIFQNGFLLYNEKLVVTNDGNLQI